ncbi:MAG: ribonuclease E activity regulator RraA [Gammaproteobacteria bacterium]
MTKATADLYDEYGDSLQVAAPLFKNYGAKKIFSGKISTVKCFEDNSFVRSTLEMPGEGKVLVVDGGGSLRCALLGDMLAELGIKNGWSGIVIYGCIRDSAIISEMDIGVKGLNTNPKKSLKKDIGERDIPVNFAGVEFVPDHFLYADEDGFVVSDKAL